MKEPLAFSADGAVAGIDWQVFRTQTDKFGRPYMDHARNETFEASKLRWENTERARDERIKEPNPIHTQYKGWDQSERIFAFRRRDRQERELVTLFNLDHDVVDFRLSAEGIEAYGIGQGYIVSLDEETQDAEWPGNGCFYLWLNTEAPRFDGRGAIENLNLQITNDKMEDIRVPAESVIVFSKER